MTARQILATDLANLVLPARQRFKLPERRVPPKNTISADKVDDLVRRRSQRMIEDDDLLTELIEQISKDV
jgi:hypothetical protein